MYGSYPGYVIKAKCVEQMALTIRNKVVLLSTLSVEIVSVVVGLNELVVAVSSGGHVEISERLT